MHRVPSSKSASRRGPVLALLLALLLLAPAAALHAAESPFADTWKMTILFPGSDLSLFLVKIAEKEGKLQGEVLSTGIERFKDSKVESVQLTGNGALQTAIQGGGLSFAFAAYPAKGEDRPKKVLGSVSFQGQRFFAAMERSDLKELDPKTANVPSGEANELGKAMQKTGKERQTALQEFLDKNAGSPALAYLASQELLSDLAKSDAAEADVRGLADKMVKLAAAYGPEMQSQATLEVARRLAGFEKTAPVAVDYARQAEKMLDKSATAEEQLAVLKTLSTALTKSKKEAEAKELVPRLAKLEEELDKEYLNNAIPFKPEPFGGRNGKSSRVVVVELFTGAQCPPCVAADVAFDAVLASYKPTDLVLLQYHLHIPGPDALTNKDTEARADFYGVQATPTLFIDGKEGPPLGGPKAGGKRSYDTLTRALTMPLESDARAKLQVQAERKDDAITIHAEVSDLDKPGEDIRLRLVLVEDMARYVGRNGQRFHHHVVRALPGGTDGLPLKESASKQDVKVDLKELNKTLNDYLTEHKFDADARPLELKHLKVVALVQNNKTKEILQAAQVDVP
jgi:hypothetical protein